MFRYDFYCLKSQQPTLQSSTPTCFPELRHFKWLAVVIKNILKKLNRAHLSEYLMQYLILISISASTVSLYLPFLNCPLFYRDFYTDRRVCKQV